MIAQSVGHKVKGYLSVKETAEKWGISVRRVNQYIREGRVPECEKLETVWEVPEDAAKPEKLPTGPKSGKRILPPRDGDNERKG